MVAESSYHTPVLSREVMQWLVTDKAGVYVDGTLGGGGHTAALLEVLQPCARVIGVDRDPEALLAAGERLAAHADAGAVTLVPSRFGALEEIVSRLAPGGLVDGLLLDLGVSSHQLDEATRGFSFMRDGPLDMRMDAGSSGTTLTAEAILNDWDPGAIADVLWKYGEELS